MWRPFLAVLLLPGVSDAVRTVQLQNATGPLGEAALVPLNDENNKEVKYCARHAKEILQNLVDQRVPALEKLIVAGGKMVEKEGSKYHEGGRTGRFNTAVSHIYFQVRTSIEFAELAYDRIGEHTKSGEPFDLQTAQFYWNIVKSLTDMTDAGAGRYFQELVSLDENKLHWGHHWSLNRKTLLDKINKLFRDDKDADTAVFELNANIQYIRKTPLDLLGSLNALIKLCGPAATSLAKEKLQDSMDSLIQANQAINR
eukprot:TRINITY_DN49386_c0_g2_i1.p1 TRINITY_DN49386_c0_g2~~TRINITY_DN49386_c0_g2_i1.p1  ORF type:complete len:256 (-),score=45.47 TRINITY_DN49386_c0_g2_i1:307-1074(-)